MIFGVGKRVEREEWPSQRRLKNQEKGIEYVINAEIKVSEVDNRRWSGGKVAN